MNKTKQLVLQAVSYGPRAIKQIAVEAECSVSTASKWIQEYIASGEIEAYQPQRRGPFWFVYKGWRPPVEDGSINSIIVKWSVPEKRDEEGESTQGTADTPVSDARGAEPEAVPTKIKAPNSRKGVGNAEDKRKVPQDKGRIQQAA